jgi:hypothetical protein
MLLTETGSRRFSFESSPGWVYGSPDWLQRAWLEKRSPLRDCPSVIPPPFVPFQVPVPNVLMKERLLVKQLAYPGFYRVVARYGYMDHPDHSPAFAREVLNAIAHYLTFGSRKELLPRSPTETAPTSPMSTVSSFGNLRASPFGHVSSSGNLTASPFGHVSSSTALNAEAARSPRWVAAFFAVAKRWELTFMYCGL